MTPSEEPPPPYTQTGAQKVDTSELQRRQEVSAKIDSSGHYIKCVLWETAQGCMSCRYWHRLQWRRLLFINKVGCAAFSRCALQLFCVTDSVSRSIETEKHWLCSVHTVYKNLLNLYSLCNFFRWCIWGIAWMKKLKNVERWTFELEDNQ